MKLNVYLHTSIYNVHALVRIYMQGLPIISFCGSNTSTDIVVPTYKVHILTRYLYPKSGSFLAGIGKPGTQDSGPGQVLKLCFVPSRTQKFNVTMWRNRHICTKFQENRHIFYIFSHVISIPNHFSLSSWLCGHSNYFKYFLWSKLVNRLHILTRYLYPKSIQSLKLALWSSKLFSTFSVVKIGQ